MKLTVLTDNVAGSGFLAEHGLSFLVQTNGKSVLFDAGHTDVFLQNAIKLGLDLQNSVDTIVLSHGHWDHADGLRYIHSKKLVAHPGITMQRYRKNLNYIGVALSGQHIHERFDYHPTVAPIEITEGVFFLGEIPRTTHFESQTTPFSDNDGKLDFVPDDSALAIVENDALHVITGCSHAGICNIVHYAQNVTGISRIKSVVGGLHLKHNNRQTQETIACLKGMSIGHIFPSHCTGFNALAAFDRAFGIQQLTTGTILNL